MEPREPNVRVSGADNRAAGRDYIERPRINVRITPPPLHPPGLNDCPSCNRSGIAASAAACPTCGHDFAAARRRERERRHSQRGLTITTVAAGALVIAGQAGPAHLSTLQSPLAGLLFLTLAVLWLIHLWRWR